MRATWYRVIGVTPENSSTNALQPGATGTVTLGYVLEDETNPVTVEVSGTLDMSGQKVTHEFALQ